MVSSKSVEFYSNVQSKDVDWLWYPYIPYGKLTIVQGDPGEGKTTFALYVASLQANGGVIPYCDRPLQSGTVIYQNSEDGTEDTIKPRLEKYGADCSNICYIVENEKALDLLDERIEHAIVEQKARLFILDPIQAFLGNSDMTRANDIRPLMKRIANIAEKTGCAIIMVGHQNKRDGGKDIYRSLGSIDIVAAARSVLLISRDGDSGRRCLTHIKSNLAPCGKSLYFDIKDDGIGDWSDLRENEELVNKETVFSMAQKLLIKNLKRGDMPAKELTDYLVEQGISERTVIRARQFLGVVSYKKGKSWYLTLNKDEGEDE